MSDRFFITASPQDDAAQLRETEAHHLLHVLRGKVGDRIIVFDGSGQEYDAEVTRTARATVDLRILATRLVDRELPRPLVLGVAIPKGDRQRWLVEKAVELGVSRLIPLSTRRGVVQPEGGTLEKLRRAVVEASKQCGRNRLMAIESPLDWDSFVREAPDSALRRVAHPPALWPHRDTDRAVQPEELRDWVALVANSSMQTPIWLAVGPEGGFTDAEIESALAAGWSPLGLGRRILRIETAALALVATTAAACERERD